MEPQYATLELLVLAANNIRNAKRDPDGHPAALDKAIAQIEEVIGRMKEEG